MSVYSIILIEDDRILNRGVRLFLEKQGLLVTSFYSLEEAGKQDFRKYHLMILDINLPDGDGLQLCREITKEYDLPVIFLTANDTEEEMIEGFECGCDDYIAKPFSLALLGKRVQVALRRSLSPAEKEETFCYEELSVDFKKRTVELSGRLVKLSPIEFKLLQVLIQNRGQVLTRNTLLEKIWDCDGNFVDENTLSVHIRRLRGKLEVDSKNPRYIITVFGIGYTFGT